MDAQVAEIEAESMLDKEETEKEIEYGARAFKKLKDNSASTWMNWVIVIRGLRALRSLAFEQAGTSDINSHAYRQKIGELMEMKRHVEYTNIDKQTRSTCYRLMDHLDEITSWYTSLSSAEQMKWKHPDAIARHCPKHIIGGRGHNRPPKKKPARNWREEYERARRIAIKSIRVLTAHDPDAAGELLEELDPNEPNDPIDIDGT